MRAAGLAFDALLARTAGHARAARALIVLTMISLPAAPVLLSPGAARAGEALPLHADAAVERRAMALAGELRCLVCQNETLAASRAALALDLKQQMRERIRAGDSDDAIIGFMVARYGDFVRYRPPLKPVTVLLWAGPFVLLLLALGALAAAVRQRRIAPLPPLDEDEAERVRWLLDEAERAR